MQRLRWLHLAVMLILVSLMLHTPLPPRSHAMRSAARPLLAERVPSVTTSTTPPQPVCDPPGAQPSPLHACSLLCSLPLRRPRGMCLLCPCAPAVCCLGWVACAAGVLQPYLCARRACCMVASSDWASRHQSPLTGPQLLLMPRPFATPAATICTTSTKPLVFYHL